MSNDDCDIDILREILISGGSPRQSQGDCPASEQIWAAVGGECSSARVRGLLDHTLSCDACAEAWRVAAGIRAGLDAGVARRVWSSESRWRSGLVAAGVMFLLLCYPAFLGLYRLPQVESALERARAAVPAGAGSSPVVIHYLRNPRRSGPLPLVHLDERQDNVVLGLDEDVLEGSKRIRRYRFEIRPHPDGPSVWAYELEGEKVGEYLQSMQAALLLPIPTRLLRPGRYELRVTELMDDAGSTYQILFETRD